MQNTRTLSGQGSTITALRQKPLSKPNANPATEPQKASARFKIHGEETRRRTSPLSLRALKRRERRAPPLQAAGVHDCAGDASSLDGRLQGRHGIAAFAEKLNTANRCCDYPTSISD